MEVFLTLIAIASSALIGWFAKSYSISKVRTRRINIIIDTAQAEAAIEKIKLRANCGFYIPGTKALAFYNFLTYKNAPNCMPIHDLQMLWAEFLTKEELEKA